MTHEHTNISKQEPELYRATVELSRQAEAAALDSGIDARLLELVRIRVSQINGCTFCMRLHTQDALEKGVSVDKIAVLPAWRETGYFDDVERDALALAERVTQISGAPRAEELEPTTALTPAQVAAIAWVAIVINAFNRIAITSHYDVAPVG
jgi:AhpD family alkylhydroperoxidase